MYIIYLIFICIPISYVSPTSEDPNLDMVQLYNEGVEHYLANDWAACIKKFESAIQDWHWWTNNTANCREECQDNAENQDLLLPIEDLITQDIYFERLIYNTLCLVKCKKRVFGKERMDSVPSSAIISDLKSMKAYDYLQLCYFQMNRYEDASNAAATVLSVQPDHKVMQNNLEYYIKVGKVRPENIYNLELKGFAEKYLDGDLEYQKGKYNETVKLMEESLELYWMEYKKCRILCESPFDQGWFPDFVSSISNHFAFTLRCKVNCHKKLSNIFANEIQNPVPSMFNYLQFSYHKMHELGEKGNVKIRRSEPIPTVISPRLYSEGMLKKAAEAVASYLILDPEDPPQNRNKQFYLSVDGVTEEYFIPRKEVVDYKKRIDYETNLLNFIDTKFLIAFDDVKNKPQELKEDKPSIVQSLTTILAETFGDVKQLLGDPDKIADEL